MATKKEVWVDNKDCARRNELDALAWDFAGAHACAKNPDDLMIIPDEPTVTSDLVAAVDALHEYVHRGEPGLKQWFPTAAVEEFWNANDHVIRERDQLRDEVEAMTAKWEASTQECNQLRVELKAMTAERDELKVALQAPA